MNEPLLLKDLCARLPYEVIVNIEYSKEHGSSYRLRVCSEGDLKLNTDLLGLFMQEEIYLKPYLRPMSSMTEEEIKEFYKIENIIPKIGYICPSQDWHFTVNGYDWLNKKMFAYRTIDGKDIFELGLALEAPEGMYN